MTRRERERFEKPRGFSLRALFLIMHQREIPREVLGAAS